MTALARIFISVRFRNLPDGLHFLLGALGLSALVVAVMFPYLRLPFERQLLIPGIVVIAIVLSLGLSILIDQIRTIAANRRI